MEEFLTGFFAAIIAVGVGGILGMVLMLALGRGDGGGGPEVREPPSGPPAPDYIPDWMYRDSPH
jgi:hypothetical protein